MQHIRNIQKFVKCFVRGYKADSINLWTDGESLYYNQTIIARRKGRTILLNTREYLNESVVEVRRELLRYVDAFNIKPALVCEGEGSFV